MNVASITGKCFLFDSIGYMSLLNAIEHDSVEDLCCVYTLYTHTSHGPIGLLHCRNTLN